MKYAIKMKLIDFEGANCDFVNDVGDRISAYLDKNDYQCPVTLCYDIDQDDLLDLAKSKRLYITTKTNGDRLQPISLSPVFTSKKFQGRKYSPENGNDTYDKVGDTVALDFGTLADCFYDFISDYYSKSEMEKLLRGTFDNRLFWHKIIRGKELMLGRLSGMYDLVEIECILYFLNSALDTLQFANRPKYILLISQLTAIKNTINERS